MLQIIYIAISSFTKDRHVSVCGLAKVRAIVVYINEISPVDGVLEQLDSDEVESLDVDSPSFQQIWCQNHAH